MIAIPNIGKPQNCAECPISALSEFRGFVCKLNKNNDESKCPLIEIDQEDEEAVLFLARMRKAMREGKSLREFLDGERRDDETQP